MIVTSKLHLNNIKINNNNNICLKCILNNKKMHLKLDAFK
jgi:hypothetical protein